MLTNLKMVLRFSGNYVHKYMVSSKTVNFNADLVNFFPL